MLSHSDLDTPKHLGRPSVGVSAEVAARPYKMTARRRAALRKAQLASAQKRKLQRRRRRIKVGIAVGTGVLAVAGAGVAGKKIMGGPRSVTKRNPMASKQLGAAKVRRTRGNTNGVPVRKGVFKVGDSMLINQPKYVQRNRPDYDAKRRAEYKKRQRKSPAATRKRNR